MINIWEQLKDGYKILAFIVGIVLVAFLGISDYLTGSELSFSIFYLIPISIVILVGGRTLGFIISLLSAVVWCVADLTAGQQYSHVLIPYWNATVRLGYFILHTILLSTLVNVIQREKALARIDPLTKAANWNHFEEHALIELQRARRARQPLTLTYLDLDNFKQVNDTFGHDTGDELIRTIVEIIQGNIRANDMVARVGGDEFVILLPDTGYEGTDAILKRIRETLLAEMKKRGWPVTFSIGAVTFNILPSSVDAMIKRADQLMYLVKQNSKNDLKHEQWPAEYQAAADVVVP